MRMMTVSVMDCADAVLACACAALGAGAGLLRGMCQLGVHRQKMHGLLLTLTIALHSCCEQCFVGQWTRWTSAPTLLIRAAGASGACY